MKVLITGSNGMLGTDLCKRLSKDHEIVGVDIKRSNTLHIPHYTFHNTSIIDSEKVRSIFEKEKPELVIHAAAWTDVDGCEEDPEQAENINVTGTENIARAALVKDVPVVLISTDYVFNGEKGEPYIESDKTSPIGVYGRTKREAEEVLERTLSKYAILRTSWLYGINGKNFADTIIKKGGSGEGLRVVNDQTGSPTYTKDLAEAIAAFIGEKDFNGKQTFHVSNTGWCSWFQFAKEVMKDAGEDVEITPVTTEEFPRPAKRPKFSPLDCGKFEKAVGFKMRPWQEALKDYVTERQETSNK